jgi:hypothetical protein
MPPISNYKRQWDTQYVIYQVSQVKETTGFSPDRVNTERNMKERFRYFPGLKRRAKKSPQASLTGGGVRRDMAVRNT